MGNINSPEESEASNAEDIRLMKETAEGNHEAFAVIVRKYQGPLVNFFKRTGVLYDAEDLAQQVFLRLYQYRKKYKPKAKLSTFLFMIAKQVRTDLFRRQNKSEMIAQKIADESEIQKHQSSSQDAAAASAEEALLKLPEEMRDVVVLGIIEEMNYEDIARIMEIPVGTVKSRMFNALRRLRSIMEADKK